ncbi:MAG: STAS domain-containing protein [Pseudonocardiaceae bacterium]
MTTEPETQSLDGARRIGDVTAAASPQRPGRGSAVIRDVSADDHGVVVVSIGGEIDMVAVPILSTALHIQLGRPECRALIADLTGITFFTARGIAVLEQVNQRARSMGIAFCLAGCPRAVLWPLEAMGMSGAFSLHQSVAAAITDVKAISTRGAETGPD